MAEVIRKAYLERLESGRDRVDTVKIVTGMRRCGKTTLMEQYMRHLAETGVPEGAIVWMNFESEQFKNISSWDGITAHIRDTADVTKRVYVFLDEVQRVPKWEEAINAMQADMDADIYISGSNAFLLSSDISTYISGRYVELKMLPLSFAEYLELHPGDREERFMSYIRNGSLPVVDPDADEAFERDHLIGIFNTVLVKDVLRNAEDLSAKDLEDISRFLYSNIGNVTSCNSIAKAIGVPYKDVRAGLDALEKAFLFYKAERYDIRGKKSLSTLEKYYVSDTGMRNAVQGIPSREDISRQVENIVYLELIRRGYEVAVGKYGDGEVDFTARKGDDIEYYQVTLSMLSDEVYDMEVRSMRVIRDNWPKTVLSMDRFLVDAPDGIKHRNVIDWLLEG